MKKRETIEIQFFCKNLAALRKATGASVTTMAERLHISPRTLRSLEGGILPPRLSVSILFRIEKEYGIPPKDMFLEKPQNYFNIFSKTP